MVSLTSASRYQSKSSMYIGGLIASTKFQGIGRGSSDWNISLTMFNRSSQTGVRAPKTSSHDLFSGSSMASSANFRQNPSTLPTSGLPSGFYMQHRNNRDRKFKKFINTPFSLSVCFPSIQIGVYVNCRVYILQQLLDKSNSDSFRCRLVFEENVLAKTIIILFI